MNKPNEKLLHASNSEDYLSSIGFIKFEPNSYPKGNFFASSINLDRLGEFFSEIDNSDRPKLIKMITDSFASQQVPLQTGPT